ncbi:MAG: hypothetical protein AAGG47_16225 [Pseudomonadota bacterium]
MTDPMAAEPTPSAPGAPLEADTPEVDCDAVRLVKQSRGSRVVIDGEMRVADAEPARQKLLALVGEVASHRIKTVVLEPEPANIPALQLALATRRAVEDGAPDTAAEKAKPGARRSAKPRSASGQSSRRKG